MVASPSVFDFYLVAVRPIWPKTKRLVGNWLQLVFLATAWEGLRGGLVGEDSDDVAKIRVVRAFYLPFHRNFRNSQHCPSRQKCRNSSEMSAHLVRNVRIHRKCINSNSHGQFDFRAQVRELISWRHNISERYSPYTFYASRDPETSIRQLPCASDSPCENAEWCAVNRHRMCCENVL
jgi:hypothetical protein